MAMENANFSLNHLETKPYRYLQQLAKSLRLPSNFRKVHLIHLIYAKKFKSDTDVNNLIQQVKLERQQLSQYRKSRKRYLQNREVSSTSKSCQPSPIITHTPKRSVHPVIRYSPEFHTSFSKCNSKNYVPSSSITRSITSSDRVLRSFNLKASIRKSFGAGTINSTQTGSVEVQNRATSPKEAFVRIVNAGGKLAKINLAECIKRRSQRSVLGGNCLAIRNGNTNQYVVPQVVLNREISIAQPKRQRTLSGIYPLVPKVSNKSFDEIQGLRMRHSDGRLTTIKALVRRRTEFKPPPRRNNEVNIQEILNTVDANLSRPIQRNTSYPQPYPSSGHVSSTVTKESEIYKEKHFSERYSVYCHHKKVRSEQVRYQGYREPEISLPKITEVFSKFNSVPRNVTEPLYVQVSEESDRFPSYSVLPGWNVPNTHLLESVYNFKGSQLTNIPLLQIATTSNTKCVYSTPVITTAMVQQTVLLDTSEPLHMPPFEPDNQYRCSNDVEMPHLYEQLKHPDPGGSNRSNQHNGDMSSATSPLPSQATIPEMVEDALEIISQDGDYMERIEMDIRVQCVLCSWAGPKVILEFHIRKEHPTQIHRHRSEWSFVFKLGALGGGLWMSQVLEHDGELCVLNVQYREPDCIVATLSSLSSDPMDKFVTIKTYNKVTGEPYTWEGIIGQMPPNLPYENDLPGLTVQLSKLDLLPNSANLKLLNKELVLKSPTKVVIGQPKLNDIHIILFVRIS